MIDSTLKINGKTQQEMGVVFEETDFTAKASQNYRQVEVEGLNGSSYNTFNYEDLELQVVVQLIDSTKENAVYAWLNGELPLEFKDKMTTVRFFKAFKFEREGGIKKGTVNFIRHPFWYKQTDDYVTVTNTVTNGGTVFAEPTIKLEKNASASIDMTIGGVRFSYNFGTDSFVEIDCEKARILYNGVRRDNQITIGYDFPKLPVGASSITIHSGDATVKVKRKDRWL